ncbi:MAG: DUF4276 family protein [Phycisphaerae bacterium]
MRRILGDTSELSFECRLFRNVKHTHRGSLPKYAKKAINAIIAAGRESFDGAVVVIDRDGPQNRQRRRELEQGRDDAASRHPTPCAVGVAVETFDAWMIADADAIEHAGGDKNHHRPDPENLDGKEGSGRHPKELAAQAFGGQSDLGFRYSSVAELIDLDCLAQRCPQGFHPFRQDVRQHLTELFDESNGSYGGSQ